MVEVSDAAVSSHTFAQRLFLTASAARIPPASVRRVRRRVQPYHPGAAVNATPIRSVVVPTMLVGTAVAVLACVLPVPALLVSPITLAAGWLTDRLALRRFERRLGAAFICDNLDAFADGELAETPETEFRLHLLDCAECRAALLQTLQHRAALSSMRPDNR